MKAPPPYTITVGIRFQCMAFEWASTVAQTVRNLPVNARHAGLIPGLGTSPGEVNGNPFQYSCLGNPMDRGAWWATVYGVAKESDTV